MAIDRPRTPIFTNVALTDDGDVWWEGMTKRPARAPDRLDTAATWTPEMRAQGGPPQRALHRADQPVPLDRRRVRQPQGRADHGVHLRRPARRPPVPLVFQSFNWIYGVYVGATMGSETTAAATGKVGEVRRDPIAMLPFCGYHMADYFNHWLKCGRQISNPPRIFNA